MQQRDVLMEQIEQLGKVIQKALALFLDLKSNSNPEISIEKSHEVFQSELDISIPYLLELNKEDLQQYLLAKNLAPTHFEKIALYLIKVGDYLSTSSVSEAIQNYKQAILLLDLSDEITRTLSFDRMDIRNQITQKINDITP